MIGVWFPTKMHRLSPFVANCIQNEYQYGSNTSLIHTRCNHFSCSLLVLYTILEGGATKISIYVGTTQDEIVFQSDGVTITGDMYAVYSSLSYIVRVDVAIVTPHKTIRHVYDLLDSFL